MANLQNLFINLEAFSSKYLKKVEYQDKQCKTLKKKINILNQTALCLSKTHWYFDYVPKLALIERLRLQL